KREQAADQRTVGLQVDHVGTVDQRIDDQQCRASGRAFADEAVQHGLAVAPAFLAPGGAVPDLAHLAKHAHAFGQALLELDRLLRQRQRIELQRTGAHRPRPPRLAAVPDAGRARLPAAAVRPVAGCPSTEVALVVFVAFVAFVLLVAFVALANLATLAALATLVVFVAALAPLAGLSAFAAPTS